MGLAQLAYHRAITAARAEPTPGAWRRLVTAARNLRDARRDGERRSDPAAAPRPEGKVIWLSGRRDATRCSTPAR